VSNFATEKIVTIVTIGRKKVTATAKSNHATLKVQNGMADVVNLRTARKRAQKQQAEKDAAKNRLAHGRSKSERKLDAVCRVKASRDLDLHRIETGEADEIAGH
jgi:hypothetical protein